MSLRNVLMAGYDGTSRVPGAAAGGVFIWKAIRDHLKADQALVASSPSRSSNLWGHRLQRMATNHAIRLALGGDHFITFPLLQALQKRQGHFRLVVLDAHHDAYEWPLLTHFSVMAFAARELGIPTLVLGVRHEPDQCVPEVEMMLARDMAGPQGHELTLKRVGDFLGDDPFYLSMDVDILDGVDFPYVSDPHPHGLSVAQVQRLAHDLLAWRGRGPLAADVVEFNPFQGPDRHQGLAALKPLLDEVVAWFNGN